jgi:hypothetical protein
MGAKVWRVVAACAWAGDRVEVHVGERAGGPGGSGVGESDAVAAE